jgi:hypothetical protein
MAKRTKSKAVTADASLQQAKKSSPLFKRLLTGGHGHDHGMSVRETYYKGRRIVIRTTYDVTVDGKKFDAALGVSNSGQVHYHGMPNVGFDSAIDLMKSVIDQFPEAFQKKATRKKRKGNPHDHHRESRKIVRSTRARATGN